MQNLQPKILGLIGTIISIYVVTNVMSTKGNVLGDFFLYLSAGGFILSILKPKSGLYLLIIAGFYLDLTKRLLIVSGQVNTMDLIQVLSFCPIVFLGIMIRHLLMMGQKAFRVPKSEIIAMIVSVIFSAAILAIKYTQSGFNGLAEGANNAAYIGFIWIAYYYLRDSSEIRKFFNFAVVAFIPVLLYAYWQLIYGYSQLEYDYALSGLTIVMNPLLEGRIEYYRIFSTMSSSSAYGLTAIILACYCLIANPGKYIITRLFISIFGVLCLASLIPGAGRAGWGMAIIILGASFLFRSKLGVLLVYGMSSILITVLFLAGDELIEFGGEVMVADSADTDWGRRAATVGTFKDRTESIKNWTTDSDYFSWFGIPRAQQEGLLIHDMLGEIYVGYGVVSFVIIILVMVFGMLKIHLRLLRIEDRSEKKIAAYLLAAIFGLLIVGIVSGGGLRIFPVNFYFWAIVGSLLVLLNMHKRSYIQLN